jgi:hypothetical protein
METSSLTWDADPLHFQFPPTKNFRAAALEVLLKKRWETAEAILLVAVADGRIIV